MTQPSQVPPATPSAAGIAGSLVRYGATFAAVLALLTAGASPAAAQRPLRADLDEWVKIDDDDLPEKYKEWLDEHRVIITAAELDVFLRLESDVQYDEFLKRFWLARDTSPGTPKNEYQEMYQERLEYVERHFSRDSPRKGRQTDRGRMYLLLGAPMNTVSLPSTQLAYPVQMWWYHANPKLGIPPYFYLAFFKRKGVGEYRLYSPMVDTPLALLNPAGDQHMRGLEARAQRAGVRMQASAGEGQIRAAYETLKLVDAELANVSLSLLPGDRGLMFGRGSMGSQMMIGDIESIPSKIMPSADWAYPILTGVVEVDVRFESLPFYADAVVLLDPSGIPFLHFGVMTEGSRLNLNNYENAWYITFKVAGSLIDADDQVVTGIRGSDEEPSKVLQANLEEEQVRRLRRGPLVYLDRLPVVDGEYEFDLLLENNVSREYGHKATRVTVPKPWPQVVRSSRPVLLWAIHQEEAYDAFAPHYPFQVGGYGLVPALNRSFRVENGIHVFQQVYFPANHAEQATISYRLEGEGGTVIDKSEFVNPASADHFGTAHHAIHIPLDGVAPGVYELTVDVEEDLRGASTFDVVIEGGTDEQDDVVLPFIHRADGPPPTDPYFALDRAQQLRLLGRTEDAIEVLNGALSRVDDEQFVALQMELLMEANKPAEVVKLLRPKLAEDPNDFGKLVVIGRASSQMGLHYDAIRYYELARRASSEESTQVLNPLASAYYADGNIPKAREILHISLELNPEQPEIRRMLDEVLSKGQ